MTDLQSGAGVAGAMECVFLDACPIRLADNALTGVGTRKFGNS